MFSYQRSADTSYGINSAFAFSAQGKVVFPIQTILYSGGYQGIDEFPTVASVSSTPSTGASNATLITGAANITPVILSVAVSCREDRTLWLQTATPTILQAFPRGGGIINFPFGLYTEENVNIEIAWGIAAAGGYLVATVHYIPLAT